jgi:hypothetical protein
VLGDGRVLGSGSGSEGARPPPGRGSGGVARPPLHRYTATPLHRYTATPQVRGRSEPLAAVLHVAGRILHRRSCALVGSPSGLTRSTRGAGNGPGPISWSGQRPDHPAEGIAWRHVDAWRYIVEVQGADKPPDTTVRRNLRRDAVTDGSSSTSRSNVHSRGTGR